MSTKKWPSRGKGLSPGPGIAVAALVGVLVLCASCIPIYHKEKILAGKLPGQALQIVALQTKSGERLEFSKDEPALVAGETVYITSSGAGKYTYIPPDKVKSATRRGEQVVIETTDGRIFVGPAPDEIKPGTTLRGTLCARTIPIADIDLVWVRKINLGATIGVSLGVDLAVIVGMAAILYAATPKQNSCPTIYSFDGSTYRLDAEPYGGAVCRGLERVEWVGLDSARPVDGRYRLLMTNELDETDRTDELKLVVVDHAPGVTVVPDTTGRMRTFGAPRGPLSAVETRTGRDIRSLVAEKDQRFWVSWMEGRDPRNDSDLKDELVLEFAKPAGARKAKLLANVWNTAWGVGAAELLLQARGRTLPAWLAEIDARGPAYWSALSWFVREEMFNLQVRVETPTGGWTPRALVQGSGAAIAKDKAYELDLGDLPGERVRIKLTPAAGFWMIDYLALDFSDDAPVRVTEVAPVSAVDGNGREVGAELAAADGRYHVLKGGGSRTEIVFLAPPQDPALARTVFVKARGYYDVTADTQREPEPGIVGKFDKPGESLRYVLMRHPVIAAGGAGVGAGRAAGAAAKGGRSEEGRR